jgi:hypothetical protein
MPFGSKRYIGFQGQRGFAGRGFWYSLFFLRQQQNDPVDQWVESKTSGKAGGLKM